MAWVERGVARGARRRWTECGGGGERRWWRSGEGLTEKRGWRALCEQGRANWEVVGIREGLERRVHGGRDSSELEEGGGGVYAGEEAWPGYL